MGAEVSEAQSFKISKIKSQYSNKLQVLNTKRKTLELET
jgi:hypothetical protein